MMFRVTLIASNCTTYDEQITAGTWSDATSKAIKVCRDHMNAEKGCSWKIWAITRIDAGV